MRTPSIALALTLALAACMQPGTTIKTAEDDNGRQNSTYAHLLGREGEFECRKSSTGHCHFVLYVDECLVAGAAADCQARLVQRFTLAAGGRREFHDLPTGVRVCQDLEVMPVAPACGR